MMEIVLYEPMSTRPCRFSLGLQNDSVFADFDVDGALVFLVRISYDGFGCCHAPAGIERMTPADSAALLAMVETEALTDAAPILRRYFRLVQDVVWPDALAEHRLV